MLRQVIRSGVGWYLIAMLNVGALLMYMFEQHIEQRFDQGLKNQLYAMVAAVEVDSEGRPRWALLLATLYLASHYQVGIGK